MTIMGTDMVAVIVSDRKRAVSWYRDVLGLRFAYVGSPEANDDPTVQGSPDDRGHWRARFGECLPGEEAHASELDQECGESTSTDGTADRDKCHKPELHRDVASEHASSGCA